MDTKKSNKESFADVFRQYRTNLTEKETNTPIDIKPASVNKNLITRTLANKNDFDKLHFVCKARSNDDRYQFKTVIHVERTRTGCRVIATDGCRLHVCETKLKIESGDYKPVVTKDSIDLKEPLNGILFPNWVRVIPDDTRKKMEIDLAETGIGKNVQMAEKMSRAFTTVVKKTGMSINLRYLEDLPKTDWVVYTQKEKGKALVLKQKSDPDGVYAVIMPLPEAA
jgi:hypothetical protein